MNKKILTLCILALLMLVSISFVSSAELNTNIEKKESPLFGIRTGRAISKNIKKIADNIITKLFGERAFFLPRALRNMDPYPDVSYTPGIRDCTYIKMIGCMYGYITGEYDCYIEK